MAIEVFAEEKSVFFVGGRGDKSGRLADAGGCTKAWWDTEVVASSEADAMAKLMTATGGPVITQNAMPYTFADNRITHGGGGFAGAEVGMVVYVIENPVPGVDVDTGRYTITGVDVGGDWIECDGGIDGTGDTDVDIEIGGAFDTLDHAVDATLATTFSVQIYTNLAEILGAAISVVSGGNNDKNAFKRICGFNSVPSDMVRGGTYYESPFDILRTGIIDLTKTVRLDANGGAYESFSVTGDNIIIENIYLYNSANPKTCILFNGIPMNTVLRNCRFSNATQVFNTNVNNILFDSCFSMDITSSHYVVRGYSNRIRNCVSGEVGAIARFAHIIGGADSAQVVGCITIGGIHGVRNGGFDCLVRSNTFYNQTVYGVFVENAELTHIHDNIFMLFPGATGLGVSGAGSVLNDYNCFIESDGTPLTVGVHMSGFEAPILGPHSIEADPLFEDAANNDFRLKSGSPCRRAGNPTVGAT